MEFVKLILSNLSGIIEIVALVIILVKYMRQAIKEKSWTKIVRMISVYMERSEPMFDNGADRKAWVTKMIQEFANSIGYDINMTEIGQLIEDLCAMSKVVNAPNEEEGE